MKLKFFQNLHKLIQRNTSKKTDYTDLKDVVTITMFDDHLDISTPDARENPIAITLEPRTMYQGILYKPTVLATQISLFLSSKKLKKPPTTVHLPPNINVSSPILPFIVLQYALALAKADIRLISITCAAGQRPSDNLLTIIKNPNSRSPILWILITTLTTCVLGSGIIVVHHKLTNNVTALTQQASHLKTVNLDYENQFKVTNKLKAELKQLQEKDCATQKILHKIHNPNNLLNTLAHHTPEAIWLQTITIGKKFTPHAKSQHANAATKNTQPTKSPRRIIIKGTSQTANAIAQLLKNLARRSTDIRHPVLASVTKEKMPKAHGPKNKRLLYQFVIEGEFVG